jgi:hypothetical protein
MTALIVQNAANGGTNISFPHAKLNKKLTDADLVFSKAKDKTAKTYTMTITSHTPGIEGTAVISEGKKTHIKEKHVKIKISSGASFMTIGGSGAFKKYVSDNYKQLIKDGHKFLKKFKC